MVSLLNLTSVITIFLWQVLVVVSANEDGECPPSYDCGYLGQIKFPFTTARMYPVLKVDEPRTIIISDEELDKYLQNRSCKAFSNNLTLPHSSPLASFYNKYNITIFRCHHSLSNTSLPSYFHKYSNCSDQYFIYYANPNTQTTLPSDWPKSLAPCSTVQLTTQGLSTDDPFHFLTAAMVLELQLSDDCEKCLRLGKSQCLPDTKGKLYCAQEKTRWKIETASVVVAAGVVMLLMVLACYFKTDICSRENPTHRIIEDFLKEHRPLPTVKYSYSDIKKITNSFKNKLGQGGFGSVYKGKLHDGRVVAVKILTKSGENAEEFINEVASISRTSHVNIVKLLGFCFDGSKRALIYEFMCNGSLEKFIYEERNPLEIACPLNCKILYDIAIGIARGLEYLHKGCNTRILHFDIKPHNILLDEEFCPKISDFGLAKICPSKESVVSIFGTRGTAGYIAPEVFSRNFGAVSHKSDVYSYGMMVLEMVGRRKNIKAEVESSSEIYFPHWIYNRLESDQELRLANIINEGDGQIVRKMAIVGLWCIQSHHSTRPTISKVLKMLESEIDLIQIPPKPFLSSPSTSPVHLSCELVSYENTKM